jgi:hypothetical protein
VRQEAAAVYQPPSGQGGTIAPVRRLIQIAIVALGIRALLRWRKRRRAEMDAITEAPPTDDPADELRQKLAESRTEDAPAAPEATVEGRRADVHEQGRATLDDMKSSDES